MVLLTGRVAVRQWLTARAADRDHLIIASVFNDNPTAGAGVVGVKYSSRTSVSLASLGRPNGIEPQLATKVVFSDDAASSGGSSMDLAGAIHRCAGPDEAHWAA